jgi:hypothetical protein
MDHPCYKCGHPVEDGKPFCAQCGAPQIRVAMPEVLPATTSVSGIDVPVFPEAASISQAPSGGFSATIAWPIALRTCAIAALIAALLMTLGLMVPLLAALGASFLAVNLYHRSNPAWLVNARSGSRIGAVCGMLFFLIGAVLETLAVAITHSGSQVREKMIEALQTAASRSNDPQVQAAFDQLKTPEGIALMLVLGMMVLFVVSIAAGGLAGALTGAFIGRRKGPRIG